MEGGRETLTGMVLFSMPVGENDKRVTLLTRERGKISAFCRGARRPKSPLLACSEPFAFGTFTVYEGRSSRNIEKAEISHYFREVASDLSAAYYGFYFLELAEYYSFENLDGTEELSLLFYTMKALISEHFDHRLVRCIFELKTLYISGEYPDPEKERLSQSGDYALRYILGTPVRELYRFAVTEEVLEELMGVSRRFFRSFVRHDFRSLAILETMC